MNKFLIVLSLLFALVGCKEPLPSGSHIMPAEWEMQDAVMINYSGPSEFSPMVEGVHSGTRDIIRELAAITKVYVLINEDYNKDSLSRLFHAANIDTSHIVLLPVYELFSMGVPRDYGPIVVKDADGKNKLMRFHWDYVGADFYDRDTAWAKRREAIRDRYFEQMSQLLKMDVVRNSLAIEGGEIELNGNGVALLVDSFCRKRNPSFNQSQFDSLLASSLGVKKVIWLREGVAEDPGPVPRKSIVEDIYGYGVGGHIDEFARFANKNTVLLAMATKEEAASDLMKKINYDRMNVNLDILKKATDVEGKPFDIVFMPIPDVNPVTYKIDTANMDFPVSVFYSDHPEWKQGDSIRFMPAVSYLNYLVFNDRVLIPKYYKKGFPESCMEKDALAKALFEKHFPGKKIIQIDPWGVNFAGGGIHCWTQQIPK